VAIALLLDTNAYSALKRGNEAVATQLRRAETVILSAVVIGELLYGFRHGTHVAKNVRALEQFIEKPHTQVATVSQTTADRYSRIAAALRAKGKPIPSNDIWIAAHAFETGALLISFDEHFAHIDGLAWLHPDRES
jgi:tRNA(fMet)-specific endonuclease VapC